MSTLASQIGKQVKVHIEKDVQPIFTSECERRMRRYVPTDGGGFLRDLVHVDRDYIEYQSPYARYQYYGKLMVDPVYGKGAFYDPKTNRFWSRKGVKKIVTDIPLKYSTAGTGAYWDKLMWTAEGKRIVKDIERIANKR